MCQLWALHVVTKRQFFYIVINGKNKTGGISNQYFITNLMLGLHWINFDEKLGYRRGTARRVMPVDVLSPAAHLYETSRMKSLH